jgi:hypothetical protein
MVINFTATECRKLKKAADRTNVETARERRLLRFGFSAGASCERAGAREGLTKGAVQQFLSHVNKAVVILIQG